MKILVSYILTLVNGLQLEKPVEINKTDFKPYKQVVKIAKIVNKSHILLKYNDDIKIISLE
jgi:hypothetical protein